MNIHDLISKTSEISIYRGVRAEDKRGGSGPRNWGTAKDDMRYEKCVRNFQGIVSTSP